MIREGERKCRRCKDLFAVEEMATSTGRLPTYCVECKRAMTRESYARHRLERLKTQKAYRQTGVKAKDRASSVIEKERVCNDCKETKALELFPRNSQYRGGRRPTCNKCTFGYTHKWLKLHPERALAGSRLMAAILNGKLIRQPCEVCGELKVHGHHYLGYKSEHHLDVKWLCPTHHVEAHKIMRGIL